MTHHSEKGMRIMRRIVVATTILWMLFVLGVPAWAGTCVTGTIAHDGVTPLWSVPDLPEDTTVRTDIVGTFLWVQIDEGEIVSVELEPTVVGATACDDGTVTLVQAALPSPAPNESEAPVTFTRDIILDSVWQTPRSSTAIPV